MNLKMHTFVIAPTVILHFTFLNFLYESFLSILATTIKIQTIEFLGTLLQAFMLYSRATLQNSIKSN